LLGTGQSTNDYSPNKTTHDVMKITMFTTQNNKNFCKPT